MWNIPLLSWTQARKHVCISGLSWAARTVPRRRPRTRGCYYRIRICHSCSCCLLGHVLGVCLVLPVPAHTGSWNRNNPLQGETGCKTTRPLPITARLLIGVFIGPCDGNFPNKVKYLECLFACQFPECFSNFSPCHSDAFVSLLPGNKQRGRARSGSAQCPGTSSGWVFAQRGASQAVPSPWPLRSPQSPCRTGRSALFMGVWSEQAPDHGNVPALGHRQPRASDTGGSLMISIRCVPTIFPFNPSLACLHV